MSAVSMVASANCLRLFCDMARLAAWRTRATPTVMNPKKNGKRASSTSSCSRVNARRLLEGGECFMADPPTGNEDPRPLYRRDVGTGQGKTGTGTGASE